MYYSAKHIYLAERRCLAYITTMSKYLILSMLISKILLMELKVDVFKFCDESSLRISNFIKLVDREKEENDLDKELKY